MSAAKAACYLMDQGAYRREVALELARGIVEDDRSPAEVAAIIDQAIDAVRRG